jgi:uncharacterized surface anchored protein
LLSGRCVDGTVTDATSGEPVAGIEVYLVSEDGDYYGYSYTDSSGQYSFEGLPAGTYFAVTDNYYPAVYADEVYDGVPCEPGCDLEEDGTPIPVTVNTTTSGIDFALTPFGRITGTVADSVTGEPISGIEVVVYDEDGYSVEYGYTDSTGTYTVTGLMEGTYFARADGGYYGAYFDELWEATPCASGCDPVADGTPISVALGETASGIDFTLQAGGVIAGTVTDAMTGAPISGIEVRIWREGGSFVYDYTDSSGQFAVVGLSTGTYFASTDSYYGSTYRNEIYDDIPCSPGCSPTAGTPIAVVVGETTAGIDFALDRLGSISGFVSEAATGEGIYDAFVTVYDAAGEVAASEYVYSGDYTIFGLQPGTYYLVADAYYYSSEIYDDIPCPYGCDPTVGTPIAVALNQTISGIDFALLERGTISVTVADVAAGEPIASVRVQLWNDDGDNVGSRDTGTTGLAFFDNLQSGVYYVSTRDFDGDYLDELYDDVPCLYGAPSGCDPTKGAAIVVVPETTREIDFALLYFDSGITGTVTDAAGAAIVGASVDVWDEAGNLVDSTETLVTGEYFLRLEPGSYQVSTDNGQGFVDEVYPDVPCLEGPSADACDPQQGVAVTVAASGPQMIVTGIDFTLEASAAWIFSDGFESGDLSAW